MALFCVYLFKIVCLLGSCLKFTCHFKSNAVSVNDYIAWLLHSAGYCLKLLVYFILLMFNYFYLFYFIFFILLIIISFYLFYLILFYFYFILFFYLV